MKIERYQDDLVVRLSPELVEALQLVAGDEVQLSVAGSRCIEIIPIANGDRLAPFEKWASPEDDASFSDL